MSKRIGRCFGLALTFINSAQGIERVGVGGIAEGALPEAHLAGRDVDVPHEPVEGLHRWTLDAAHDPVGMEPPAVEHGEAAADVAQRDHQVHGLVGDVGGRLPARHTQCWVTDAEALGRRSIRRSSSALKATTIVDADMSSAPAAGGIVIPAQASAPPASGMAATL